MAEVNDESFSEVITKAKAQLDTGKPVQEVIVSGLLTRLTEVYHRDITKLRREMNNRAIIAGASMADGILQEKDVTIKQLEGRVKQMHNALVKIAKAEVHGDMPEEREDAMASLATQTLEVVTPHICAHCKHWDPYDDDNATEIGYAACQVKPGIEAGADATCEKWELAL